MRLLMCAGEPSGDIRGGELLRALSSGTAVEAFGMGGDSMAAEGMETVLNIRQLSVMGFTEVLRSLPRVFAAERELKRLVLSRNPDALVLVDYPGFNMRLGAWARARGIPVVQYIAPQTWAWGAWRTRKLAKSCSLLLVILPFEEDYFRQRGINSLYTGHPLADQIPVTFPEPRGAVRIALLPGSRGQEVTRLLPEMVAAFRILQAGGEVSGASIAVSESVDPGAYPSPGNGLELAGGTAGALQNASAALVCSGTATLETAMHGVPQVICYKTGRVNFLLAKLLVRGVGRIGLANLVAGADIATELLQGSATARIMAQTLSETLRDPSRRSATETVRLRLGPPGGAGRAAEAVIRFLESG
ncbi:MAG: lipid-A-disaccharide synthase [Candidatus Fermentibacteraceae bacterium]